MQDAAVGCAAGESWRRALQHYTAHPGLLGDPTGAAHLNTADQGGPGRTRAKPEWGAHEGTERKVDLLYIKAHRLAGRYVGKQVAVHVYDDRRDIIEENAAFYSAHPSLLPSSLTIHLHLYSMEHRKCTGESHTIR